MPGLPELTRAQLAAAVLALAVVVALGVRWMQRQAVPSAERSPAAAGADRAAGAAGSPASVRLEPPGGRSTLVHVAGAVRRPGVYRLPDGARVQDAVRRAGGASGRADTGAINLAAPVVDGQQVVVPRRVPAPGGGTASAAAAGSSAAGVSGDGAGTAPPGPPISLNTATAEQLDTLDGVGPATAQKILAWRRDNGGFRSVDDLGQVPGIGPKRLAALRDRVQP